MFQISQNLIEIFFRILLAVIFSWILFKSSLILFNFSIEKELKRENKAIALFWVGFLILIGLIVSLFKGI